MKYLLLLMSLFLFACSQQIEPEAVQELYEIENTPTVYYVSTPTYVNYQPTVDYALTQVANAEATSDAALIISIQATESEAQRRHEMQAIEHEYVMLTAQSNAWTVTSAPTSIPLTATAQADMNTAIANQQNVYMVQATQTFQAPELQRQMNVTINTQKYSFIEYLIRYVSFLSICFFITAIGIWLIKNPKVVTKEVHTVHEVEYIIQPTPDAVVAVQERKETAFPTQLKVTFPCTPEQLDELADKVINRGMSLAYDNYTGNDSKFTRKTYAPVYAFMIQHKLAIGTGQNNKGLILTDREFGAINGRDILTGWLESRTLPEGFSTLASEPANDSQTTPLLSPKDEATGISPLMGQLVPVELVHAEG